MNHIQAKVSAITQAQNLTIVSFSANNQRLRMMSLGLNMAIEESSYVTLGVKATSIALAKDLSGQISMSNQLPCKVTSINKGELLSSIILDFYGTPLESIITTQSLIDMQIKAGENLSALIKASELSIVEVPS